MRNSLVKDRRRRNGEGSIFQYRGGWRAATRLDTNGKRCRRIVSGKRRDDVRREPDTLRADLDRGLAPPASTTLGTFLASWLEASRQRIRHSTWRGYESCVRVYLVPAHRPDRARQAGTGRRRAGNRRHDRLGAVAADRGLTRVVLRRALGDALRDGLVHRNVAALARPPHVPSRSLEAGRDYLSIADLRRPARGEGAPDGAARHRGSNHPGCGSARCSGWHGPTSTRRPGP